MSTTLNGFFSEQMQDSSFKEVYESLELDFSLAKALADFMARNNLNQEQLAERLGITQSSVSKLLNASGNPSFNTVKSLAKAMGLKVRLEFVQPENSICTMVKPTKTIEKRAGVTL